MLCASSCWEQMKTGSKFWLGGTCFLLWLMILLGGATRLTHSGLSIVEWQPLTGIIPPLTETDWHQLFQSYQQFPEYQQLTPHPLLSDFKFIFWMEYTHRLLGRFIGIFFLIPLILYWRSLSSRFKKGGCIVLALGLFQGFIGWYMVKSGLVKDPLVSPYRLTLHLGLAFVLYGMVLWMLFEALAAPKVSPKTKRWPYILVFGLQVLTMLYGGLVGGHKAGMIYNTFPLMEGQWLPQEWSYYQPFWINFFKNPAMVQWLHRTLAVVSWCGVLSCLIYERNLFPFQIILRDFSRHCEEQRDAAIQGMTGLPRFLRSLAMTEAPGKSFRMGIVTGWFTVSTIQVLLGIVTLLYQVPLVMGVLHQGWAVVVLTAGLKLLFEKKCCRHT